MSPVCRNLVLVIFSLSTIVCSASPPLKSLLPAQCWHEYPLSTVSLQSSVDGTSELIFSNSPPAYQSSNSPKLEQKLNYGPWTHPPVCTGVLETLGSKICVYTNATFSNGRGISIVTIPKIAEELAGLPAFQDAAALRDDDVNIFSGVWYTGEVSGKGIGVMAKKRLNFKDRITAYTPALIAIHEDELPTLDREKLYRLAVYQLPEGTRDSYLGLAYIYGQRHIRVQDIVKANTFQLEYGGKNHLAIFPETSRINHDCGPNAQYYLDHSLLTHFVHATREILPGEEITISYTSPFEPTEQRQQQLKDGFHFTCSCSRCRAKDATDSALYKIRDMQTSLNDWSPASTGTPKLAEKMIQLYRKEGLDGFLDIPYGFAALAYNAIGDTKKAAKYAEQAREMILLKDGPWTQNLQIWNELLKDPKKHWSYKRRQQR